VHCRFNVAAGWEPRWQAKRRVSSHTWLTRHMFHFHHNWKGIETVKARSSIYLSQERKSQLFKSLHIYFANLTPSRAPNNRPAFSMHRGKWYQKDNKASYALTLRSVNRRGKGNNRWGTGRALGVEF
jgi:hypothetical protein